MSNNKSFSGENREKFGSRLGFILQSGLGTFGVFRT